MRTLLPFKTENPTFVAYYFLGFLDGSVVKNPSDNVRDMGLIPGSGRCPGEEMATHSSTLAWEISWTEEPGGLQSMGLQRVEHN